jgi:hypothetical protein
LRKVGKDYPVTGDLNSLQVSVTRRFQGGGTLLVAYTNSKLLSNTDTTTSWLEGGTTGGVGQVQDFNNLNGEKSLSSQDVSQRLVISRALRCCQSIEDHKASCPAVVNSRVGKWHHGFSEVPADIGGCN